MCGFVGIFSPKKVNKNLTQNVEKMTSELSHRGPDEKKFFIDDNIILGFNRLSIIDLDGGSQPMISSNKKFVICLNGEIYNYKKLRQNLINDKAKLRTQSDTEVFLELFSKYGLNCLDQIRGMFSVVIYDLISKKITLIRDRFGMKPLFFSKKNDNLIFSSEISPMINSGLIDKSINYNAVNSYLSFRYPHGENSYYTNISNLDAASVLQFSENEIRVKKYWKIPKFNSSKFSEYSEKDLVLKLDSILKDTIKDHTVSDVPIGGLLSGGLDSSLLMSLIKQNGTKNFETFSAKFSETEYDESPFARSVASHLNIKHNEITLNVNDYIKELPDLINLKKTPLSIPHEIALYHLFKEIKKKTKVVISGEGADEIFGGYGRVQSSAFDFKKNLFLNNFLFKKNQKISDFFISKYNWISENDKKSIFTNDFYQSVNKDNKIKMFWEDEFSQVSNLDPYDQFLHMFQKHHLVCLLDRLDFMSMASGVEARTPFVDHEVVEFINSVPFNLKFKWKSIIHKLLGLFSNSFENSEKRDTSKYLLRRHALKYLPKKIVNRKKLGFPVPLDKWLSDKTLLKFVKEILLDNKTKSRGIFDVNELEKIINNNQKLEYDFWGKKIWMLLNLELWFRDLEK